MKIVVSGASGLIGSALVPLLRDGGHDVLTLVRGQPRDATEIRWDPAAGQLDAARLAGVEAAVHLAGAGVGERRWTPSYRRTILDSRVQGTDLLSRTLARQEPRPAVLLSASAVGWYGDTGDREVDESAPRGAGFLADVVGQWEAATRPAVEAGIRVCLLRTGLVLSTRGGALAKQLPLFKAGLGGRLGSGRQYQSWISLPDEVAAIRFLLGTDDVRGPVNLVGPAPVTNAEFTKTLATALRRPAFWVVPAPALRLVLGGFADESVLAGQRVRSRVLDEAGFSFAHQDLAHALHAVLTARS